MNYTEKAEEYLKQEYDIGTPCGIDVAKVVRKFAKYLRAQEERCGACGEIECPIKRLP